MARFRFTENEQRGQVPLLIGKVVWREAQGKRFSEQRCPTPLPILVFAKKSVLLADFLPFEKSHGKKSASRMDFFSQMAEKRTVGRIFRFQLVLLR